MNILNNKATAQIGKDEYPPIPKITLGLSFIKKYIDCEIAVRTLIKGYF